jgi:hypothetical protein
MEELFRKRPEEQERIGRNVANFSVALFGVNGSGDSRNVNLVGSGTLVSLEKSHYVLTAAHVWHDNDGLKKYESTGLTLKEDLDQCFPIKNEFIAICELPETKLDEWGPDIILLRVPPELVGAIEAFRVFYRLDKERRKINKNHLAARIMVGTPGVLSEGIGKIQHVVVNGLYVQIDTNFYGREGFDYIDFDMDTSLPGVMKDFRGVSGGGVWEVEIFPTGQDTKFDSTETLVGVAYYQLGLKNSHQTVRCHGPKTIQTLQNIVAGRAKPHTKFES